MKVAIMLEELVDLRVTTDQFNYEPHKVDLRQGETRTIEFKEKLNPNGKVPVIVDPFGPEGIYLKDCFDQLNLL